MFKNIHKFGNKIAIDDKLYGQCSYKDLINYSNKLKINISEKNICLLICGNNLESIVGYLTFMNSNKIVTLLVDKSFKVEFMNKIIEAYKPKYIFAPQEISFKKFLIKEKFKSYNFYESKFNLKNEIEFINYLLLPTSGTTQNPKFVRLSKKNLLLNSKNIINELKIKKNHTTITTMPMGYSYGLSILNTHLLCGAKIILNNHTIFEKFFWDILKKKKVSSFGGVPDLFEYLKKLKFENQNLSSIKYISQAGGKLNIDTENYLENVCGKKKIKFFKMYGQTEASPRISILQWKHFKKKKSSVGKPLRGSKIIIIDKRGNKIKKNNVIGEIYLEGENVCLGYAKSIKDLFKKDTNKKKLLTGDLAFKDEDGFLYIVGRKKRIIKIFGIRINMDDIENLLKKNNINCKCKMEDNKIKLNIDSLKFAEVSKNILSENLGINKNFILVEQNTTKTLKSIYINEKS